MQVARTTIEERVPPESAEDAFAREIEAIGEEITAQLGPEDVRYLERLNRFSRAMEAVGRTLIHFSLEPVSFSAGVGALFIHKQLQTAEIGHTVMHGAYDRLEGTPEKFKAKSFVWDAPMDEESWRFGHNSRHHNHPNVLGRDRDTGFGPFRLHRGAPYRWFHRFQGIGARLTLPFFSPIMGLQFSGVLDAHVSDELFGQEHYIGKRDAQARRTAWRKALRKLVPYYAKNYVLFPALAGPFFWKVLAGNWLAERLRDAYTSTVIYCGHVGPDVAQHPEGFSPKGRAAWLVMQVESSQNFEVPWVLSILAGGLDRQIEHHLFPSLPPHRLRQIVPKVRAACEKHGVKYLTGTWPEVLDRVFGHLDALSKRDGQ